MRFVSGAGPDSALMLASNQAADHRKIEFAVAGLDRLAQPAVRVARAARVDCALLRQPQRIGQILPRILDRKGARRKLARKYRLHAVVAQREAVGRALELRTTSRFLSELVAPQPPVHRYYRAGDVACERRGEKAHQRRNVFRRAVLPLRNLVLGLPLAIFRRVIAQDLLAQNPPRGNRIQSPPAACRPWRRSRRPLLPAVFRVARPAPGARPRRPTRARCRDRYRCLPR